MYIFKYILRLSKCCSTRLVLLQCLMTIGSTHIEIGPLPRTKIWWEFPTLWVARSYSPAKAQLQEQKVLDWFTIWLCIYYGVNLPGVCSVDCLMQKWGNRVYSRDFLLWNFYCSLLLIRSQAFDVHDSAFCMRNSLSCCVDDTLVRKFYYIRAGVNCKAVRFQWGFRRVNKQINKRRGDFSPLMVEQEKCSTRRIVSHFWVPAESLKFDSYLGI